MPAISINAQLERRLSRLAKSAGSTPEEMLPQVMQYGFGVIEDTIRKINQGKADIVAGRVYSTDQVFAEIERRRAQRLGKHKKAA